MAFGVTTNQAFLMACLRHPAFAKGEATTGFIGSHRDALVIGDHREEAPVEGVASEAALAALLLYVTHPHARNWHSGRTLAATFPIPLRVEINGTVHQMKPMGDVRPVIDAGGLFNYARQSGMIPNI